jgi:predicted nucleic acid-binding protein
VAAVVADASAIVELLLRTPRGLQAEELLRGQRVSAPAHMDAEVLSAFGRLARARHVDEPLVEAALAELERAPIRRYPVTPLLLDSWALRERIALRDGLYVTLAQRLGATLLTVDSRLARTRGLPVTVTLLA